MSELVLYEVRDRVGYITLNRPEKRNALGFEFVVKIKQTLTHAIADPQAKVLVLQAAGDAFCAGADLAYLQQLQKNSEAENLEDSRNLMELFQLIHDAPKTILSKVNGPALAGGCGLATTCDFVFATPHATFGYTEVKIGFIPAMVMVFLMRMTSGRIARQLILSGEIISAETALQFNLINQVIAATEIDQQVHEFATKLAAQTSSTSVALIKTMLNELGTLGIQEGLEYAARMNVKARSGDDCKKGIAAFLNKEKLKW